MDKLLLYAIYLLFPALILGPTGKIVITSGVNVYPNDFIIALISLILLFRIKSVVGELNTGSIYRFFYLFIFIAILSLSFSPIRLNLVEKFVSVLYLVRFLAYFNVYIALRLLIRDKFILPKRIGKLLGITGIILCITGWLQYLFYPDLRNLVYLGWDPHDRRIFGTYLDPNFYGLMTVLTSISLFFYQKKIVRYSGLVFSLLTMAFTYSRGTYLSLVLSSFYYSFLVRRFKMIFLLVFLFLTVLLYLPRPVNNAGVNLGRIFSVNERFTSWNLAWRETLKYPVLGVGFDTLKYLKENLGIAGTGYDNHSAFGIDNSILFVAVTTGFIGLLAFIIFLLNLLISQAVAGRVTLLAVLVHGLFTNSFFFPFAMIWLWMICAAECKPLKK